MSKLYLISYNAFQAIGWSYLMFVTACHSTSYDYWTRVRVATVVFQTAALLEVVHAACGLVRTGVLTTLAQVYSRVFVVFGALLGSVSASSGLGLPICMTAWTITETVRYWYYVLNLLERAPAWLVRARYSTFIVLYPVGVLGELACMSAAMDDVGPVYREFLACYMILYLPAFPAMFSHMMRQRRRVLYNK